VPTAEEIKQRIEAAIPGARAEVEDYTAGATISARRSAHPRLRDAAASSSTSSSTASSAMRSAARSTRCHWRRKHCRSRAPTPPAASITPRRPH